MESILTDTGTQKTVILLQVLNILKEYIQAVKCHVSRNVTSLHSPL